MMIFLPIRRTGKIGQRVKLRRKEFGLTLQYVAERMDVSASTILRYENGSIDNTKKLIVEHASREAKRQSAKLLDNLAAGI